MAGDWQLLDRALDRLGASGREARFWWRDDDAVRATPQLDRLIDVVRRFETPLLLAVIPALADATLAQRLQGENAIVPAVHGFAHANHAGPGEKKQELGPHRPSRTVLAELARGRERLQSLLGDRLMPVLVPPWNRIAPDVAAGLNVAGFTGMSVYGPEDKIEPLAGVRVVNTHLDPIDWHGSRSLVDRARLCAVAAEHVERCARGDEARPLGLLTHHLVHDDAVWGFVEKLVAVVAEHPACHWRDPRALFTT